MCKVCQESLCCLVMVYRPKFVNEQYFFVSKLGLGKEMVSISLVVTVVSQGGGMRWWRQEVGLQISWKKDFERLLVTSSLQWFELSDKLNVRIGHATSKIENYMDSPFLNWFQVLSVCAVNEVMPGRRSVFKNWADYYSVEMEKLFIWNSRSLKLLQEIQPFVSFC